MPHADPSADANGQAPTQTAHFQTELIPHTQPARSSERSALAAFVTEGNGRSVSGFDKTLDATPETKPGTRGVHGEPWRVAAVIPGFGKHKDVELLLHDLSKLDLRGIEFWAVLVDNNTPVPLSTVPCPPNVRLEHLRMPDNTGGAGGFNAGMARVISGQGLSGEFEPADFVWLVDSDARVTRRSLRELVRALVKHKKLCAAGSALFDLTTKQTYEIGGVMHPKFGFFRPAAWGDVDRRKPIKCDYLAACSALVRREAIEQTGLMPDIFIHGDDVEWFLRMCKATGHKVAAIPASRAGHPLWNRKFQTWVQYYTTRNAYAPIDAVGFGGWCRFKRAMVDVLRACGQAAVGVHELAELHLKGLEDAAANRIVGVRIPGGLLPIVQSTKVRPFSELAGFVKEKLGQSGNAAKLYVNPLLVMRAAEFKGIRPQWESLGISELYSEAWHRRNLQGRPIADMARAALRALFVPLADVAVVPTGLPCAWFRGKTVVMLTSDGFFVRSIGRWEAIKALARVFARGCKSAVKLAVRARAHNAFPPCPVRSVPASDLVGVQPNRERRENESHTPASASV